MCSLNVQHGLLLLGGFQRGKSVGLFSALPVDSSWSSQLEFLWRTFLSLSLSFKGFPLLFNGAEPMSSSSRTSSGFRLFS